MKTESLDLRNMDCMELMAEYPDNHFDLAVVDPPYGIKESSFRGKQHKKSAAPKKRYKTTLWQQNKPNTSYFKELKRVSKNQIVWGGNYFIDNLTPTRCFIVWDKQSEDSQQVADCELAYTSFDKSVKKFTFTWNGMLQGDMKNKEVRIHPTQKPVKLYDWIFANYAEKGMKILDTHMGSGSIAIAAHYAGMHLTACELDEDYFKQACDRVERETRQTTLF